MDDPSVAKLAELLGLRTVGLRVAQLAEKKAALTVERLESLMVALWVVLKAVLKGDGSVE